MQTHPTSDTDNRVIDINDRRRLRQSQTTDQKLATDIELFAKSDEPDDFRHRMVTNAIAFAFVTVLVVSGLWLANSLALMRKNQDCVLSGKRGCTPVEAPVSTR